MDYHQKDKEKVLNAKKFFETKAMKRLGRISQLGLAINNFPNLYHSRLEHSNGVRVGYYDRNGGSQTIVVSLKQTCNKKEQVAFRVLNAKLL